MDNKDHPWCKTSAMLENVSFSWTLENFAFLSSSKKTGEKLESSNFSADGDEKTQWRLYMYPKGHSELSKNFISLFVCLVSSFHKGVAAKFEFSIKNEMGDTLYSQHSSSECLVEPFEGKGYTQFISHTKLFDESEKFLLDRNLRIHFRITYQSQTVVTYSNCLKSTPNPPESPNITNHFDQLLKSGQFSDITFNVRGREFRAHKLILVSRSQTFANILQHDLSGRLLDYLEIEDILPEVFHQVLRFIYTDQVENLNVEGAKELLKASEKYSLPLLKFECEKILIANISEENCLGTLELATFCSAFVLKKACISFIQPRVGDFVHSHSWAALKVTRPDIIISILEPHFSE